MAVAQLFFPSPPVIIPLKPTKPSRRYKSSFLRIPPTSSSKRPLSLRCLSTKPISAVVKDRKGFGGRLNWSDFWRSSLLSYWNEDAQADEKFLCHWAKDGTVAETKDEMREEERKINKSKRRFGVKLCPKIYMVIVGVSFGVVLAIFFFSTTFASGHKVVPYSDLVGRIRDGSVMQVQFVENSRVIYFNTKSSVGQDAEFPKNLLKEIGSKWQYHTRNVGDDKHQLIRMLKDKGITYGSDPELFSGSMKNFLFSMLQLTPYWIMVLLSFYQFNAQHNLGRMTKRKPSKKQSVTFDDVEGLDDAKAELLEIVLCINGDSKYMKLGAKLPRGVLLAGPPGTGKTLLARAVAGEAGVSFFSISASELVEVFVGAGAARVRDIFREARKWSPSIIFIDEIDAVGGRRGRTLNCERDQTLNQLLTEMDGFEKDASVVVIAATNRPETLDPALMRPGRFSRKVVVGEPDEDGRRKIFALYLKDVPMQEDKEAICNLVASRTPGLVGAALENIANESVLLAARRDGDHVTRDDILQAVERVTTKRYSDENAETESPYSFGSMAQGVQFGGGSMGFGFPNS